LYTIIWAGDRYVAIGASGLATSFDGLQWEVVEGVDGPLHDVAWNGEQLLVVGYQLIFSSDDFTNFTSQTLDWEMDRVVWAGDRWVVSASSLAWSAGGHFLVSLDGQLWEVVSRPGSRYPARPVAWDGSTVLAIDYGRSLSWLLSDDGTVIVPAAAHLSGLAGSRWRTDLQLHNPREEPVTCTVELLERGVANDHPRSAALEIGAEISVRMPDVLATEFGFDGAAALRIRPSDGHVMVSSRTYDDSPAGTYGQLVPGMHRSEAIWPSETGRLIQLRHLPDLDTGFRTNIGLVSLCADSMDIAMHLFLGSGESLGNRTVSLPPWGVTQLNNVFEPFTDQDVTDGFAILSSATPRCAFHAYASVVDNRTNDPILVPIKPWTPTLFGGEIAQ